MLNPKSLDFIKDCAREFDVEAVWLFGSSLGDEAGAADIDLAVEGIDPRRFFDFYGRLFFDLPKPVDLVDMSDDLPIVSLIRKTGVRIYGRGS
jgi:predicted nucleotidyltransferase